ncbi:MAG: EamA family transporter [Chloroflexota bacterium]
MTSRIIGVLLTLFLTHVFGIVLNLGMLAFAGEPPPTEAGVLWALAGGVAGTVAIGALWLALARGAMGLVSPLTALIGASIPAIIGILTGDPLSPLLAAGMLLALVAIGVISLPDRRPGERDRLTTEGTDPLGWLLILLAGLGSAGFYLCSDRAHEAGSGTITTLVIVRAADLVLLSGLLLISWLRDTRRARTPTRPTLRVLGFIALISVIDSTGTIAYLTAAAAGSLSIAVILGSFYPVSTAGLARVVLHERLSRQRLAGIGLAVIAAAMIGAAVVGGA